MKNRFFNGRPPQWVAVVTLLVSAGPVLAVDRLVTTQAELTTALSASKPGDAIVLQDGVWSNLSVNFQSLAGTLAAPIAIRAQTAGRVVISGPNYFFDVGGSNYEVSGLSFRDENALLKSIRFRGSGVNVHDNAIMLGGRYNDVLWDAQPASDGTPSSFHNNFLAGKQDRGVMVQLDSSFRADLSANYFGFRPQGGPSSNSNGWETIRIGNSGIMDSSLQADVHGNYFEATEGEAETISDKTHDNHVADNTFRNIRNGWVTARLGGDGVYEGNTFLNALGIRVGNSDDAIPDHPGLSIRKNYIEGPNAKILLPGSQTDVSIQNNTVIATVGGTYNGATYTSGRYPFEYTNTTAGAINGNLFWISDSTYGAVQAGVAGGVTPVATGGGNVAFNAGSGPVFASATPTAIRNLFQTTNPNLARDPYNLQRPATVNAGIGSVSTALARNSVVGPAWLDPVTRLNKFMPLEARFNADLSGGFTSSNADNTGYLSTPATLKNSLGVATNLHSADALGVSGRPGDRAFDNRATTSMGNATSGRAAVIDRQWFRNLEAFTLQGWFKTDAGETIGGNASLIEQTDANGGWSLRATSNGALTLTMNSGSSSKSVVSDAVYTAQNQWTFFAVTFDARPSSNEVAFYIGNDASNVALAGTRSLNLTNSSDTVSADLLIGSGFDGLLDNLRLFSARKSIDYIDDTGSTFTKNGNGQDYAVLSLAELRTIRRYDLGIPIGDLNESRTIDATDIDLVTTNAGNAAYDIDGDGDTDRADRDLLLNGILHARAGDTNLDQIVNFDDLLALSQHYTHPGGWAAGDFDGNGVVDFADLLLLSQNYGVNAGAGLSATANALMVAPEPGVFFVTALVAMASLRRRGPGLRQVLWI